MATRTAPTEKLTISPFLKWAGGKRRLIPKVKEILPHHRRYHELFLGGGAIFFGLLPQRARISDFNWDIANCYTQIRDNMGELETLLENHADNIVADQSGAYFYAVRDWDRHPEYFETLSAVERAARYIFINKCGFNGMMGMNSKGQLSITWNKGRYNQWKKVPDASERPNFNYENMYRISEFLQANKTEIVNGNGIDLMTTVQKDDLVFLDPPYMPLTKTAKFTEYTAEGFSFADQIRLVDSMVAADARGAKIIYTNADRQFLRDLFSQYPRFKVDTIVMNRLSSGSVKGRGKVNEILVTNF